MSSRRSISGQFSEAELALDERVNQAILAPSFSSDLVSLPLGDTGLDTADPLLDDICDADMLWRYLCDPGIFENWGIYHVGEGFNTPPGIPFYVNIPFPPEGCEWTVCGTIPTGISYTLCAGLNIVSVPLCATSITKASELLAAIPNCNAVYRYQREYDCDLNSFDLYGTYSPPSADFPIQHGRAYWVMVSALGAWTPCP